eukprot:s6528_g2.t1
MEVSTSPSPQAEADVVAGIACILLLEISLLKHFDSLVVPCVSSFHVDDRANFGCVRVSCNSQAVWQRYRCCEQLNQASRGSSIKTCVVDAGGEDARLATTGADFVQWSSEVVAFLVLSNSVLTRPTYSTTEVSFNSCVSSLATSGAWEKALAVVAEMSQVALRPDGTTLGAFVGVCATAAQWRLALALLHQWAQKNIAVDQVAVTSAIHGCSIASQIQALALFVGTRADGAAATAVISSCQRAAPPSLKGAV